MKFYTYICFIALLTFITVSYVSYGTIIDTFTDEDKAAINQYILEDREKDIQEIAFKDYITHKIIEGSDPNEIKNGYRMIYKLTETHRLYFGPLLITHINNLIHENEIIYQKEIMGGELMLVRALYALGIVRSQASIDYLSKLIAPLDVWPKDLRDAIKKNPDNILLVAEIREDAMGALLQPQDVKGRELLTIIEEKVKVFPDNDSLKDHLLKKIETWKRIYSSGYERFQNMK